MDTGAPRPHSRVFTLEGPQSGRGTQGSGVHNGQVVR